MVVTINEERRAIIAAALGRGEKWRVIAFRIGLSESGAYAWARNNMTGPGLYQPDRKSGWTSQQLATLDAMDVRGRLYRDMADATGHPSGSIRARLLPLRAARGAPGRMTGRATPCATEA